MKHFRLSALIFSAHVLPLILAAPAYAQDEGSILPEGVETTAEVQDSPPPSPEDLSESLAKPPEDRPGEAPLGDDPNAEINTDPNEALPGQDGPAVDSRYNTVDDRGYGFWSQLRVGPTVQLGFPHPITYGIEAMVAQVASFGFSTGSYEVTQIDKANVKIKSWDVFARWHPFFGSFFLGGAFGHQDIDGRFEDDVELSLSGFPATVRARVDAEIQADYFSPRLGWLAVYDSGLTFGFEIGAQIPLSPTTKVEATIPGASPLEEAAVKSTPDYKDLKKQADDAVKILGKKSIPYLTLFKLGWLF